MVLIFHLLGIRDVSVAYQVSLQTMDSGEIGHLPGVKLAAATSHSAIPVCVFG
jgi:hypothetical protein